MRLGVKQNLAGTYIQIYVAEVIVFAAVNRFRKLSCN